MVRAFRLPDVGEGIAEGELVEWLVEPGDRVEEDQPVAKVETDKALVEVPAPVDGAVGELRAEEGETVPVGEVLVVFEVEGEADGEAAGEPTAGEEAPTGERATADDAAEVGSDEGATEGASTPGGRAFAPPSVRRLARELGVDLGRVDGSARRVTEADVRAAAEGSGPADATTGSVAAAPVEGSGIDAGGEKTAGAGESATGAASAEPADRDRTLAAPATRRIAEEEGVDIDEVPAVETRDGEAFVTPEAVREYARTRRADAVPADSEEPRPREEREPYRGVRRRIGESMAESRHTAPHATHHDDADVTELVAIREDLAERAEDRGIRLTYVPFVLKAVVRALEEHPSLNASLDEEREEIVYKNHYDVGVATDTDAGLMVPVVEDVDEKGLLRLAAETDELVQRARDRSISPEELRGSTFTVTNVGVIGGEYATPIINPPEAAILATGEIRRKPRVVVDEETGEESVEPRDVLPLSLSIDHRIVDGADAAAFTNRVIESLENPHLLLLE